MAETGIQEWWAGVPIVTKYLFSASMGLTLTANFLPFILKGEWLVLLLPKVFQNFELWRLVTSFFFHGFIIGPPAFAFLMSMAFLLRYSQSLETTTFAGRTADYIYMLLVSSGLILVIGGFFMNARLLAHALIMVIIYVWSRKNPEVIVTFMFGLRFKATYLTWVLIGFSTLMGASPILDLIGVFTGHVYFYLEDIYPLTGGRRLLETPQFLLNYFPPQYGGGGPQGRVYEQQQQQQQQQQRPQGHQWGGGRPLGGR